MLPRWPPSWREAVSPPSPPSLPPPCDVFLLPHSRHLLRLVVLHRLLGALHCGRSVADGDGVPDHRGGGAVLLHVSRLRAANRGGRRRQARVAEGRPLLGVSYKGSGPRRPSPFLGLTATISFLQARAPAALCLPSALHILRLRRHLRRRDPLRHADHGKEVSIFKELYRNESIRMNEEPSATTA